MALPPDFLDELRARTPLPGLIGRRVRLARSGRNWKACCPFHTEKSPSFYVYDDHYHCFGCGAHGDAITFVMQTEGAAFMEAVERLAAEAGLEVPKPSPREAERERERRDLHSVLAAAAEAYARRLRAPEGAEALAYLKRRGVSEESIARFGLGWSGDGRGGLVSELAGQGIATEQMEQAGLLRRRDDGSLAEAFFNRVMFPIRDRRGRVIAFGGRTLGEGQPKYVNSPETPLFAKRRALYGLDLAREAAFRGARVVVVEGYLDVIALDQAGRGGERPAFAPVAPLGTALTEEQLEEIWRLTPEPVLCFDGDAAGARAAARAAETALPKLRGGERWLRFARGLPGGQDPDTFVKTAGIVAFKRILEAAVEPGVVIWDSIKQIYGADTDFHRAARIKKIDELCANIQDIATKRAIKDGIVARERSLIFTSKKGKRISSATITQDGLLAMRRNAIFTDKKTSEEEVLKIIVAIMLKYPYVLEQSGDELISKINSENSMFRTARDIILKWYQSASQVSAENLSAYFRERSAGNVYDWASSAIGLPEVCRKDGSPTDVERAWFHFMHVFFHQDAINASLESLVKKITQEEYSEIVAEQINKLRERPDS
jgi:DNA primase